MLKKLSGFHYLSVLCIVKKPLVLKKKLQTKNHYEKILYLVQEKIHFKENLRHKASNKLIGIEQSSCCPPDTEG